MKDSLEGAALVVLEQEWYKIEDKLIWHKTLISP